MTLNLKLLHLQLVLKFLIVMAKTWGKHILLELQAYSPQAIALWMVFPKLNKFLPFTQFPNFPERLDLIYRVQPLWLQQQIYRQVNYNQVNAKSPLVLCTTVQKHSQYKAAWSESILQARNQLFLQYLSIPVNFLVSCLCESTHVYEYMSILIMFNK